MERTTKRRSVFGSIAIAVFVFIATAFGLFVLVSMSATVTGSASLPNGITARINGPFSCSEQSKLTTIEAGGHTFTFTPATISIDGVAVSPLDSTVTDVQIDVSGWSASLRINGNEIPVPK